MNKQKAAFTLAEIFTVLTLLGIVAAITIPSTIQTAKKKETVTRLKIAYNMLTKLTEISKIENMGAIPSGENHWNDNDWNKYVRPYIEIAHDCGTPTYNAVKDTSCFAGENGGWYNPNGAPYNSMGNGYGIDTFHKVILKNGMSLAFQSCKSCMSFHNIFVVDIDGPKKGYSIMGQDVFVFEWANPTKVPTTCHFGNGVSKPAAPELVPYEAPCANWHDGGWFIKGNEKDNANNCIGGTGRWMSPTSFNLGGLGSTCAGWIIRNNWVIPKDYPWSKVNKMPKGFKRP